MIWNEYIEQMLRDLTTRVKELEHHKCDHSWHAFFDSRVLKLEANAPDKVGAVGRHPVGVKVLIKHYAYPEARPKSPSEAASGHFAQSSEPFQLDLLDGDTLCLYPCEASSIMYWAIRRPFTSEDIT